MGYLLDSNAVINYLGAYFSPTGMAFLNSIVDSEPIISVMTKMETLGYQFESIEEQTVVEAFVNGSTILNINNEIVNETIAIRKNEKNEAPRCHHCCYSSRV